MKYCLFLIVFIIVGCSVNKNETYIGSSIPNGIRNEIKLVNDELVKAFNSGSKKKVWNYISDALKKDSASSLIRCSSISSAYGRYSKFIILHS